ncbi:hypothetical protein [Haloterrigena salina]|nr:hypothetical protein [Haloterrigena salina]
MFDGRSSRLAAQGGDRDDDDGQQSDEEHDVERTLGIEYGRRN